MSYRTNCTGWWVAMARESMVKAMDTVELRRLVWYVDGCSVHVLSMVWQKVVKGCAMVRWGYCSAALLVLSLSAAESDKKLDATLYKITIDYCWWKGYVSTCVDMNTKRDGTSNYSTPSEIFGEAAVFGDLSMGLLVCQHAAPRGYMTPSRCYEEVLRPYALVLDEKFHKRVAELGIQGAWVWFKCYIEKGGLAQPFDEYCAKLTNKRVTRMPMSSAPAPAVPTSLAAAVASAGPSASSDEQPGLPKPSAPVAEPAVVVSRAGSFSEASKK